MRCAAVHCMVRHDVRGSCLRLQSSLPMFGFLLLCRSVESRTCVGVLWFEGLATPASALSTFLLYCDVHGLYTVDTRLGLRSAYCLYLPHVRTRSAGCNRFCLGCNCVATALLHLASVQLHLSPFICVPASRDTPDQNTESQLGSDQQEHLVTVVHNRFPV